MLVDCKRAKLRIHRLARRSKRILNGSPLCHRHLGYAVQRRDEIAGHGQSFQHSLPAVECIAAPWSNRFRIELTNCVESLWPGAKMGVTTITGGVILNEIAREHDSGIRNPGDNVTRRMAGTKLHELYLAL